MGFDIQDKPICDSTVIKNWLVQYRERWKDIETQDELFQRIKERMVSTSAKEMTGMPHSGDPASDKFAFMISQKDEVDARIKELIQKQEEQRKIINELIARLRSADERSVITLRYLSDSSWNAVNEMMFGARDDYEDKEESYLRRITKAHGRALHNIAMYVSESAPENIKENILNEE